MLKKGKLMITILLLLRSLAKSSILVKDLVLDVYDIRIPSVHFTDHWHRHLTWNTVSTVHCHRALVTDYLPLDPTLNPDRVKTAPQLGIFAHTAFGYFVLLGVMKAELTMGSGKEKEAAYGKTIHKKDNNNRLAIIL